MSARMRNVASGEASNADTPVTADQGFDIVLEPLSHPELGKIRVEENLFAIGRTEAPFDSYAPEIVADLSRRHARIFSEYGAAYIADLDSKNGTTLNGVNVQQKISRLHDGDEICFGRVLTYRVRLGARADVQQTAPKSAARLASLTLTPERDDIGLQPIIITQLPFLISKADDAFARYKEDYPHQVNYLSRRHAHIFLKGGSPFVEDLGSTNGTFLGGERLEEHAAPLKDGDTVAFGGHHFVYKVSLQHEDVEIDPTVTKLTPSARKQAEAAGDADKTTFVAAADSFLDIFCIDHAPPEDDEHNNETPEEDGAKEAEKHPPRGKLATWIAELSGAFGGGEAVNKQRLMRWGAGLGAVLLVFVLAAYFSGSSERELKDLMARGAYAEATEAASRSLARNPDNAEARALGTEALLKANVPPWLRLLKAREFDKAATTLAGMRQISANNPDARGLIDELEWAGNLEKFVLGRGGVDAPIRLYTDETTINALLKRWNDDTQAHQRSLDRIASLVPEFKEPYAEVLSHLRKLQSDDSVYLAATERLKASLATELNGDHLDAIDALLKDYAEKYPRLGGLDRVRQDLRRYVAIDNAVRARNLGQLAALLAKPGFATPPFQTKFRALQTSGKLPPADVMQRYQAVASAWKQGNTEQAFAGLQKLSGSSWADAAAKELEHKKGIAQQFGALQKTRGTKEYDEHLLAFYGGLSAEEDTYFLKAVEADVGLQKEQAVKRARELMDQAQARWRQYQDNGGIEARLRLETGVSNQFRNQARLLTEARDAAQQGMRIVRQLKTDYPAPWNKLHDDIVAEAEGQRKSLQELRGVLEPRLMKEKLTLLGGPSGDQGKPPQTAN
jgi:pSer/pThr/pTyr-binding forkhead associated (FHA) protein